MDNDLVMIEPKDTDKNGVVEINAGEYSARFEGGGPFEAPRAIFERYLTEYFEIVEE